MEKNIKELVCIVCPKGCHLLVQKSGNGTGHEGDDYLVSGYGCDRGEAYGKKELKNPTRVLTSIVRISGGQNPCCPVKTDGEIPKKLIGEAMNLLRQAELHVPVVTGDVVVRNVCGTDCNWVVTKDMEI